MRQLVIKENDLAHNIQKIREAVKGKPIIGVIKGNAYGMGLLQFARLLTMNDVDFFAVYDINDAKALRQGGFNNEILILASIADDIILRDLVKWELTATIGSFAAMHALEEASDYMKMQAKAHVELETGFGRSGFLPEEIDNLILTLKKNEKIKINGIYSHLSQASSKKKKLVRKQVDLFNTGVERINAAGIATPLRHISSSGTVMRMPETHLDAVRVGSALLGRLSTRSNYGLRRVGYLRSNIIEIKTLPKGHNIGYANRYKTKTDTVIAIVPVGYSDGYGYNGVKENRKIRDIFSIIKRFVFSKKMTISFNGKPIEILGRIGMTNIVIDVTGRDAKVGDTVILDCNPIFVRTTIERAYI